MRVNEIVIVVTAMSTTTISMRIIMATTKTIKTTQMTIVEKTDNTIKMVKITKAENAHETNGTITKTIKLIIHSIRVALVAAIATITIAVAARISGLIRDDNS